MPTIGRGVYLLATALNGNFVYSLAFFFHTCLTVRHVCTEVVCNAISRRHKAVAMVQPIRCAVVRIILFKHVSKKRNDVSNAVFSQYKVELLSQQRESVSSEPPHSKLYHSVASTVFVNAPTKTILPNQKQSAPAQPCQTRKQIII